MSEPTADMLFEASWEVCNKCGGIYTVVTSKISLMQANYDNYCLIGPLFDQLPSSFMPQQPPASYAKVFSELAAKGIKCKYGIWSVPGKPATILIDARSLINRVDEIKGYLWNKYGVDSLYAAYDFNEPLTWAWGVGMFLESMGKQFSNDKIVAHLHEWLTGFALLYLKDKKTNVATVFTTHATMLGRTLASHDTNFYDHIDSIDPENEARKHGVVDKFSTERACALQADVFTTVSEMTAKECEAFFGIKPDVLPNGLEIDKFPTFEETSYRHITYRERLYEFLMSHFFPYQTFDLNKSLFFYYGGRYEYSNKGFDIIIESLAKLNDQLKEEGSKKTIVMFFFVAMHNDGPKRELLENKSYVEGLSATVREKSDYFLQQIVLDVLLGDKIDITILPKDFVESLRREFMFVKRTGNPILCTHKFGNEEGDPTLKHLKHVGLDNNEDDRVKVVFIPAYLYGGDGLLNLEYYEAVSGCHLGIFPSYYEPWGYTPLESIALGVPAVTTTTAGFGKYIQDEVVGTHSGLFIIDRSKQNEKVVEELLDVMKTFVSYDRSQRVSRKMNAHALSTFADWRQLIRYYLDAHKKALDKHVNS